MFSVLVSKYYAIPIYTEDSFGESLTDAESAVSHSRKFKYPVSPIG